MRADLLAELGSADEQLWNQLDAEWFTLTADARLEEAAFAALLPLQGSCDWARQLNCTNARMGLFKSRISVKPSAS